MKVKVPLFLLLIVAAAIGYMMGTEQGRSQRDIVLVKLGRKDGDAGGDPTPAGPAATADEAGADETVDAGAGGDEAGGDDSTSNADPA